MVVHKAFRIAPDEPIARALSDVLYHILHAVTVRILYSYSPTLGSNKNINTIIITTPFIVWYSTGRREMSGIVTIGPFIDFSLFFFHKVLEISFIKLSIDLFHDYKYLFLFSRKGFQQ